MNSRSETMNAEKESMMNSSNGMAGMPEPRKEEILFPLENVLPHCAVILVLDTSHSMWGAGLRDMMRSLDHFYKTIQAEQFLNARIDIAAVSMGDNLRMLEEFSTAELENYLRVQQRINAAYQGDVQKSKERYGKEESADRRTT